MEARLARAAARRSRLAFIRPLGNAMPPPPFVYVLLVNWNGWADTTTCLESVCRLDYPHYRIIVCDNGSTNDSLAKIKSWARGEMSAPPEAGIVEGLVSMPVSKPVRYAEYERAIGERGGTPDDRYYKLILIQTGANLGFAGGNNVGLRYALSRADFQYVWLLNNDTVVKPDALSKLVERAQSSSRAGLCGSTVLYRHAPTTIQALAGASFNRRTGSTALIRNGAEFTSIDDPAAIEKQLDCILGASMLVSAPLLHDVGLMSEAYFLYYEEVDWALRARTRYDLLYAADSVVYHVEGGSIGSGSRARKTTLLQTYYSTRSRLRLMRTFFPQNMLWVHLDLFRSFAGRILSFQLRNALVILRVMLDLPVKL